MCTTTGFSTRQIKKIDVNFLTANMTRLCGGAPFGLEGQILSMEMAFKANYPARQKALCLSRLRFFSPERLGNGIRTLWREHCWTTSAQSPSLSRTFL
jgi:hypothetical protein